MKQLHIYLFLVFNDNPGKGLQIHVGREVVNTLHHRHNPVVAELAALPPPLVHSKVLASHVANQRPPHLGLLTPQGLDEPPHVGMVSQQHFHFPVVSFQAVVGVLGELLFICVWFTISS